MLWSHLLLGFVLGLSTVRRIRVLGRFMFGLGKLGRIGMPGSFMSGLCRRQGSLVSRSVLVFRSLRLLRGIVLLLCNLGSICVLWSILFGGVCMLWLFALRFLVLGRAI